MNSPVPSLVSAVERPCDIEPIHVPGSIQPHGVMLLFDAASDGLAYWAGDVSGLLGLIPEKGSPASQLLGVTLERLIGSRLLIAGEEATYIGLVEPAGKSPLSVVASRSGPFLLIELEPAGDESNSITALERVRSVSDRLSSMPSRMDAYDVAVAHVRAITGYDHVMIYQFLLDGSGSVVAEARAPHVASLLNHRFPASDIPRQARDLYRRNLIRVIPDVSYQPAPLQPPAVVQIDMSHSVLRSVAPVHIQYLKNMGVGASMSISLMVNGELWGLIACHHRVARHVTAEARLLCRHVGTALSSFIFGYDHAEYARRRAESSAKLEEVLESLRAANDPERKLRLSSKKFSLMVDCGGFALLEDGEMVAKAGRLPDETYLRELAPLVEARAAQGRSFASDNVGRALGLRLSSPEASGVLAIRIDASRALLALWVRPEQHEEISWAGDPREKDSGSEPQKKLTPRRSFATWREIVHGRSTAWTQHEIDLVEHFQGHAEFIMQRHRLKQLNEELGRANATLSAMATTDALTGLPNRRLFDERLKAAWEDAIQEQKSLAIVTIDVDNFKKYNDCFGHPAGDECLKQVAAVIGEGHRESDVGARLGGEEFGLLLPDTDAIAAKSVAEGVRTSLKRLGIEHPANDAGIVTISLGIAAGTPAQWGDIARLLGAADAALYNAKNSGRDRTFIADPQC